MGFRVWGLGFGVWGLEFGAWGWGFWVSGFGLTEDEAVGALGVEFLGALGRVSGEVHPPAEPCVRVQVLEFVLRVSGVGFQV